MGDISDKFNNFNNVSRKNSNKSEEGDKPTVEGSIPDAVIWNKFVLSIFKHDIMNVCWSNMDLNGSMGPCLMNVSMIFCVENGHRRDCKEINVSL